MVLKHIIYNYKNYTEAITQMGNHLLFPRVYHIEILCNCLKEELHYHSMANTKKNSLWCNIIILVQFNYK